MMIMCPSELWRLLTPQFYLLDWYIFIFIPPLFPQAEDDNAPIHLEKHLGEVERPFKENVTRYDGPTPVWKMHRPEMRSVKIFLVYNETEVG